MSDEIVRVPAALAEALRKCVRNLSPHEDAKRHVVDAARALVDAATPAAPVGEPRKPWVAPRGGGYSAPNTQNHPPRPGQSPSGEPVPPKGPGAVSTSTPAPLSSPRRTRDEGTEDEAEAWAEWRKTHAIPHWDGHGITKAVFIAGFRAARLAREDDR